MKTSIPKDWRFVKLGDVLDIQGGSQPPKSTFLYQPKKGYIQLLQIRDFGERGVPTFVPMDKVTKFCKKDDIMIARYGASLGRIMTGMEGAYNVAMAKVIDENNLFEKKYIYYLLKTSIFQGPLKLLSRSAQNGFSKSEISHIELPLPPKHIQTSIVSKIEELFSELDKGIENLRLAQQQLKTYRQAVLQSALSGQFTKEWRLSNNTSDIKKFLKSKTIKKELQFNECNSLPINWGAIKLSDISERVSVGHVGPTSEFYCAKDVGIPFLRSQNVRKGKIDFEGMQYITKEFHLKLKKSQLKPGDLLIVRVGANRGDACTLPENMGEINCANIVFARPIKELSKFLHYYFISPLWLNLIAQLTTGSAQGVINTTIVAETVINLPSIEEQNQIIMEIESHLSMADKVEECIVQSLQQNEALRQSILKKAFEGKIIKNY